MKIRVEFDAIDTNKDGFISKLELKSLLLSMGLQGDVLDGAVSNAF